MEDKTQLVSEEGPVSPPYLVVIDGPNRGARFPLQEGVNILGRLDECHVVLDDQSVSRKHAELSFQETNWELKDFDSKNGTKVNGAVAKDRVVIGHKDLIQTGIYTLRFIAQPISAEEEGALPTDTQPAEVSSPESKNADTARLDLQQEVEDHDDTAPHSPLEEEASGEKAIVLVRRPGFLKAMLVSLFVCLLGGGLYYYWATILSPTEEVIEGVRASKKPPKNQEGGVTPQNNGKAQSISLSAQSANPQQPPPPPPPPVINQIPVFLDCIASPFPAAVSFQGKELGKTPLKFNAELEPEKAYKIEALFEMPELHETYAAKLNFVVAADQSTIPLLFRAPVGTIKVEDLPRDVTFYLEAYFRYNQFQGRPVKLTELTLNKPIFVPYGRYILELRQPREVVEGDPSSLVDNIVYRREFYLEEETPTFILNLDEMGLKMFPAKITSKPSGADVLVDGVRVGATPFDGMLPIGKHQMVLQKEGFFEYSQEIKTDINMPFETEVTMKTSPAGEKINQAKGLLSKGLFPDAVNVLSEVFTLSPAEIEKAEARYLLGTLYLRQQDYSKAKSYFEQAGEHSEFRYLGKIGVASVLAEGESVLHALKPLVEVLLNAKEENVLREANTLLRKISPLRSVVYIHSDPKGADVFLNGEKLEQQTPLLLHELGLGSYKLRVEMVGHQPVELALDLKINEFKPIFLKLKPADNL